METCTHRVRTQILSLYPKGLAIGLILFVVGSQRVGLGEEVQVNTPAHRLIAFGIQVQPLIQRAATVLVIHRVIVITLKRRNRRTKHIDTLLVCLTDNLLVNADDALSRLNAITRTTQVIDSLEEDNPLHALLTEQIALIAVHGSRP